MERNGKKQHSHPNLLTYYRARRYYDEALVLNRAALPAPAQHSGRNLDLAATLSNLAWMLRSMGRRNLPEALRLYEEALGIRIEHHGEDHIEVANARHDAAGLYYKLGQLEAAREMYELSLATKIKHLGEDHLSVASTLYNIGLVLSKQRHAQDAIDAWERTLCIWRERPEPDFALKSANALYNIGIMLSRLDDFDEAARYFDEALVIRRNELGDDHIDSVAAVSAIERLRRSAQASSLDIDH